MKKQKSQKLWGKAYSTDPNSVMIEFTSGHDVYPIGPADEVLIPADIKCNLVQAKMLYKQKLISASEYKKLKEGLVEILTLFNKGKFKLNPNLEDVHSNVENYLISKYGIEVGGKIHTGRSRNDQIVTDMFIYLHEEIDQFITVIENLNLVLLKISKKYKFTICPGYTHHQHAIVTSLGFIFHSYYTAFNRDLQSFKDLKSKFNFSPLGAGTAYGTLINIDSGYSAIELGFAKKFANPIDVISNRGEFEAGLAFAINQYLVHASNLSETLILFSMTEFGFLKLADQYCTGSSIMPQKKNPDSLELIKAASKVAQGELLCLINLSGNNFIGFNRDSQESKYKIYHLIIKAKPIATLLSGILNTISVNAQKMEEQANKAFINATGLMELIITEYKIPMRVAKQLIEKSIKQSSEKGKTDKVDFVEFMKVLQENKIHIGISEDKFNLWQDAKFQLDKVINSYHI